MIAEVVIGLLVIALVCYIFITKENLKNLPPGPKGKLWFGITVDIKNMHREFTKWWKEYGDVFEVKIYGRRILVLNSPETIRKAFASGEFSKTLNHRPSNFIGYKICDQYQCVLLRKYDKTFKNMKKVMIESMDAHGFKAKYFRDIATDILQKEVLKDFTDLNGRPIDPINVLRPSFCKMIGTLFSASCSNKLLEYIDGFDCHGDQMIKPQIHGVYKRFPWIRWIPFSFYRGLYKMVKNLKMKLKKELIFEMRQSYDKTDIKCMIHHLFREQELQKMEAEKPWLTDNHINGIAMDLINTSILTTKSVMSGFIFLLLHFPHIQEKIQAEIDNAVGQARHPELTDRENMPFVRACILECLRYQSHLPLTAAHYNTEKVDIFGYTIPPKTIIFGNLFACHHDEKLWEEPWEYKPERFLTQDGQLIPRTHQNMRNLIAFGVGERRCVGEDMALDRVFLYTTHILQKFSFVVPNGSVLKSHDPREMEAESPVILPPKYMCRVVKRKTATQEKEE